MTNTATRTRTTTRAIHIDGRPVPAGCLLAHWARRWARNDDGSRMSAAQLRAHLAAEGVPTDDLTSKSWSVRVSPKHVLASKVVK